MHPATPVLLLTQDDFLWQHWRVLGDPPDTSRQWLPARGRELADLRRWREQGRSLAVIDAELPRLPAFEPGQWQPLLTGMQAVIASVRPSDDEGMQAMLCGARGYCHAYAPAATWAQVLHAITTGSVWMGASLVARLLRQVNALAHSSRRASDDASENTANNTPQRWHHDALSEREHTIALHVAQGEANGKIAAALGISERTVKAHLTAIFEKLGVADRLQLALRVHGVHSPAVH